MESGQTKSERRSKDVADRISRFTRLLSDNKQEIYSLKKSHLSTRLVGLSRKTDPLYLESLAFLDAQRLQEIDDAGITRAYSVETAHSVLLSSKEQAAKDYDVLLLLINNTNRPRKRHSRIA
jgi:hypothetical protein